MCCLLETLTRERKTVQRGYHTGALPSASLATLASNFLTEGLNTRVPSETCHYLLPGVEDTQKGCSD